MKVTFEMDNELQYELVGDLVCEAVWAAYNLGRSGSNLVNVTYTGCEEFKNFQVTLSAGEVTE